jgi:RNA polymerase sigma-70 factor (ECF subfamily)
MRETDVRSFLDQHVPSVYRFAIRLAGGDVHAAEDLVQETMCRAWRRRSTMGRLDDADATRRWLFRVLANIHRDDRRRAAVRRRRRPERAASDPDQLREAHEHGPDLLAALDALPPRQRDVLYLSACEGLGIGDIAVVLAISPGACRSSLSLARARMRELLAINGGDAAPAATMEKRR